MSARVGRLRLGGEEEENALFPERSPMGECDEPMCTRRAIHEVGRARSQSSVG